jgi:hypothetical protein
MDLSSYPKNNTRSRNVTPDTSKDFIAQNISRASSSVSSEKSGVNVKLLTPMPLRTKDKLHELASPTLKKQQPPPIEIPSNTPRSELLIEDQNTHDPNEIDHEIDIQK